MFCRNCGKELKGTPEICIGCGAKPLAGNSFCQECGAPTTAMAEVCVKCGVRLAKAEEKDISPKSRLVATLLCFFVGGLGVHRFYIGHIGPGIGILILSILGWGTVWIYGIGSIFLIAVWIWVLIDFILIIAGSMKDKEGKVITNWQA